MRIISVMEGQMEIPSSERVTANMKVQRPTEQPAEPVSWHPGEIVMAAVAVVAMVVAAAIVVTGCLPLMGL